MKKAKAPGLVSDIEKEVGETVKTGKEQASLGEAFNELLRQIFGGAKPLSPEAKEELEKSEEEMGREARAKVLEQFMGPSASEEDRVYYKKQKEEAMKKMEEKKKAKKKAKMTILQAPKGRKQRGSLFESLRRKTTKTERKGGKF